MGSKLNTFGSFIGVASVIGIVGWVGVNHYSDTRDERLPIKVKQGLAKFQSTLPIEIRRGLMLEKFQFTRSSINFTFKINKMSSTAHNRLIVQERLEIASLVWLCKWRERFIRGAKMKVMLSFVDKNDLEIASVVNKTKDCEGPVPTIPKKMAS